MSKQWVISCYRVDNGECQGYYTHVAANDIWTELHMFTKGAMKPTVFTNTTRAVSWLRLVEAHFSEHLSGRNNTLHHLFFCLEEYKQ